MPKKFLEKDLEQFIFDYSNDNLRDKGLIFFNDNFILRQVNLGNCGVVDLIGFSFDEKVPIAELRDIDITIYELKQNAINLDTLFQALGYFTALKGFLRLGPHRMDVNFKICLIGKTVDIGSNWVYLLDFAPNLTCFTYEVNGDDVSFFWQQGYTTKRHPRYPQSLHKRLEFFSENIMHGIFEIDNLPF